MAGTCECGAEVQACTSAWHECLALELQDPEYGAVHHLTVAAYILQHGSRLAAHGWREMRDLLRAFLDGQTPQDTRRASRIRGDTDRPSLTRGEERSPSGLHWTAHITDLCRTDPARYREDVRTWATTTLREATTEATVLRAPPPLAGRAGVGEDTASTPPITPRRPANPEAPAPLWLPAPPSALRSDPPPP